MQLKDDSWFKVEEVKKPPFRTINIRLSSGRNELSSDKKHAGPQVLKTMGLLGSVRPNNIQLKV